ncbi:MAG: hypothetical protein ACR2NA_02140 [Solirubrobacterales bacterium]
MESSGQNPPEDPEHRDLDARERELSDREHENYAVTSELAEAVDRNTTWLYATAGLASIAAILGAIALIFALNAGDSDTGNDNTERATKASLEKVRNDVDDLKKDVDEAKDSGASDSSVSKLDGQLDEVSSSLDQIQDNQKKLSDSVSKTSQSVKDLEQRVDDVESEQSSSSSDSSSSGGSSSP